jgi:hypothetical protein
MEKVIKLQKRLLFLFLLMSFSCIGFPSFSADDNIKTGTSSEPYLFIDDLIQVTSYIDSSVQRFKLSEEEYGDDDIYATTKMMKGFRTAIYDLEQAKIYLKEHINSKNEMINSSAAAMLSALDLLIKNYNGSIKYLEQLYSSTKEIDVGEQMGGGSKLTADRDEILKLCMTASIMATYSLVSDVPDKNGKLPYLTITTEERDNLKKKLEDYFGEKIKDGLKAGQSLSITPAAALYEFLKRDFIPADKREG